MPAPIAPEAAPAGQIRMLEVELNDVEEKIKNTTDSNTKSKLEQKKKNLIHELARLRGSLR